MGDPAEVEVHPLQTNQYSSLALPEHKAYAKQVAWTDDMLEVAKELSGAFLLCDAPPGRPRRGTTLILPSETATQERADRRCTAPVFMWLSRREFDVLSSARGAEIL